MPLLLVIGFFVLVAIAVILAPHLPWMLKENYRWRKKLSLAGRFDRTNKFRRRIQDGTLIVDAPTLGWGILQCWWTEDRVESMAPMDEPSEAQRSEHQQSDPDQLALPWDRWVTKKYIDVRGGQAVLIATRRGDKVAKLLASRAKGIQIVRSWSASVHFDDQTDGSG